MQSSSEVMDMLLPEHGGAPIERLGDSAFFAVRSWDLVAEATERVEDFSSNLTATMVIDTDGGVTEFPVAELGSPVHALATADGDVHRAHRKLVLPSLSPRTLRSWKPFVEETLRALWEDRCVDGGIDWVADIAEQLPPAVIAELVGFPRQDRDRLLDWAFASTAILDGAVTPEELETAVDAVTHLLDYLSGELTRARSELPTSVIGDLARLVNTDQVDHDVAVQVLVQLLAAGVESTVGHLGTLAWRLGRHPEHVDRLRADPSARPGFIEEVLRIDAPFRGHYRHVVRDTVLGGLALPEGSHLFLLWGSANRDPNRLSEPDGFRPDRDDGAHLSFGRGIHFCVGAALARLESAAALDLLLELPAPPHIEVSSARWQPSLLVRRLTTLPVRVEEP